MKKALITSLFFLTVCLAIVGYKVFILKYSIAGRLSAPIWRVHFRFQFEGDNTKCSIGLLIPPEILRQRIYDERIDRDGFTFQLRETEMGGNLRGYWEREKFRGRKVLNYEFSIREEVYPHLLWNKEDAQEWLKLEEKGTSRRKMEEIVNKITAGYRDNEKKVDAIFRYVKERESKSAHEKVQLLLSLLRTSGIPSRLVGGIILEEGFKKDIHYWVEAFVENSWRPFCVVNGYAWEVPHNYLILFWEDTPLIKKRGVKNFQYAIWIERDTRKSVEFMSRLQIGGRKPRDSKLIASIPSSMQSGIRKLLVVPLGALVVVLFRNVIGVNTFGTFTPILVALSFYQTELVFGLMIYFLIVLVGCISRSLLEKLRLLMVPRLSIILTLTICAIIVAVLVSYHSGMLGPSSVFFLPMVIITMTVERFYITQTETGIKNSLLLSLSTVIVACSGYLVMSREIVQLTVYSFPEILLGLIGIFVLLGRYTGFRLSEIIRFRQLREE